MERPNGTGAEPGATEERRTWWGEFRVPLEVVSRWRIGPLSLWVRRLREQWRVAHRRSQDPLDGTSEVLVPLPGTVEDEGELEWSRYGFGRTDETLGLRPALADRSVVARPGAPFSIPPGQRVEVYVSSALWVRLLDGGDGQLLVDLPSWRPSDTWFGTNRSGSLCYATRTTLRTRLEELPLLPHRAVTPIAIQNRAKDPLLLERVCLPIPNLSLYADARGLFWTEHLDVLREDDGELAGVEVLEGSPEEAVRAVRVAEPRRFAGHSFASRVFDGLFR